MSQVVLSLSRIGSGCLPHESPGLSKNGGSNEWYRDCPRPFNKGRPPKCQSALPRWDRFTAMQTPDAGLRSLLSVQVSGYSTGRSPGKSGFFYGKQSTVLAYGIAVRHPGDIVGNRPWQVCFSGSLEFRRQQARIAQKSPEQVGDDAFGLVAHARHPVVLVQVLVQEFLELLLFLLDFRAECDERRCIAHVIDPAGMMSCDQPPAAFGEIGNQRVDHAPDRFMNKAAVEKRRVLGFDAVKMAREYRHGRQLLDRDQARA